MFSLASIDNIIIFAYLGGVLIQGIWVGRHVKDIEEYAVAGSSYPALIVFATLSASFIGGGFTMGNAEKVFLIGIANIVALWGFSLKEILVARFIAPRTHHFPEVISVGDIMEQNYGKLGKIISGIFGVLLCGGILGAQVGGIGYIFNIFLDIPVTIGIFIGTGIVIAYATVGGMRAVVATDIIQFIILSIGIPLALILGIQHIGGLGAMVSKVPTNHFTLFGSLSPWQFASLFLTFLLGETLVPPYVQRLFIGKTSIHTARGTLWSGFFSIPFFTVTGLIGLLALILKPDLNANLSLPFVIGQVLPIGLRGLIIAGIISVVMSSADSFLNSASICFINDIVRPLRRKELSPKEGLLIARLATLVTGSLAVIFAIKIKSVLDILIYAYNFWAPIIMIPLAATLLGVRASTATFLVGAGAGMAGVFIWDKLLHTPAGFDGLIVGIFANLAVFTLAHHLTKKHN